MGQGDFMPEIFELFGRSLDIETPQALAERKAALCPFIDSPCDGGGNRHQTKINLKKSPELASFFEPGMESVIPGICSISYNGYNPWVVCPRRLLGFKNSTNSIPQTNKALQPYEKDILLSAGIEKGKDVGVWSEIYLRYGDDETEINYHFDFIAAPLIKDVSFQDLFRLYSITDKNEKENIIEAARKGKLFRGKYSPEKCLVATPDLSSPIILEVMTASTSGSNTELGTNISTAFTNAIFNRDHQSPGINKRQVWGRMATQLFAKSAIAEAWNGKTVWIVQDELLKNIELTTKLAPEQVKSSDKGSIIFVSLCFDENSKIKLKKVYEGDAGVNLSGNQTYTDILLPKIVPSKQELLKSMLRRNLAGVVNLSNSDN